MKDKHHSMGSIIAEKVEDFTFDMIFVEGGEFMMGDRQEGADKIDLPIHKVIVQDFYVGKYFIKCEKIF